MSPMAPSRPRRTGRSSQSGHGKAGPSKWQRQLPGGDISRILDPAPRIERDAEGEWHVRHVPASGARKVYTCPGCGRSIPVGVAHVVVWRTDALFGDRRAVEERRHWHQKCWRGR